MKMTLLQRDNFLNIMKEHFKQAPNQEIRNNLKERYDIALKYRDMPLNMAISVLKVNFTRFDRITTDNEIKAMLNHITLKNGIRIEAFETGEIYEIQFDKKENPFKALKYVLNVAKSYLEYEAQENIKPIEIIESLIKNGAWENENFKIEYLKGVC